MAHILVADDEEKMRHLISIMLESKGYKVSHAFDGIDAFERITRTPYDMLISDIRMPRMNGLDLLKKIKEEDLLCPVVFITAFASVESAVDAMRMGAVDYLTKPFDEEKLLLTVERSLNFSRVMAENRDLKRELLRATGTSKIVVKSKEMKQVLMLGSRVAKSDSVVMISGESGTGKELMARFIHHASPRHNKRFVAINCAAISPNLVESELYGYEKGAFTGADRMMRGKFEFADKGTLFLDEIGDLPLDAQAKLLRTLQEKKIRRVGGNEEIPIDVRILCATNRNLEQLVVQGGFRRDLFYRINVVPIELPPLRERMDDVIPLAKYFLERISEGRSFPLTDGAVRVLLSYSWPGNVRELANAMERAYIVGSDQGGITGKTLSFLQHGKLAESNEKNFKLPAEGISLEELQHDLVSQALEATGNNQSMAANMLGITRAKFRVLLKNARGKNGH